jgi:hypothetical protein
MTRIQIELTASASMSHVPLAALGYALRGAGLLDSLRQVILPIKTLVHTPGEKLIEALILTLAGGRSTAQADLLIRPNRSLAQAWGQPQFAQQSTLADTLDAFDDASLSSLRSAFESTLHQRSSALAHDFRKGDLFLDADLTGLPASRRAEGSAKGYFSGEKTKSVGKPPGSACPPTANRSVRYSIPRSARACLR